MNVDKQTSLFPHETSLCRVVVLTRSLTARSDIRRGPYDGRQQQYGRRLPVRGQVQLRRRRGQPERPPGRLQQGRRKRGRLHLEKVY